jgi:hypothetical protein
MEQEADWVSERPRQVAKRKIYALLEVKSICSVHSASGCIGILI